MSVTMAMARIKAGKESTMSMMRIRTLSGQPLAQPATAPKSAPMRMAKPDHGARGGGRSRDP